MSNKKERRCLNEGHIDDSHAPATFGVYCHQCLAYMKKSKRERKASEDYARAAEWGYGDFWRFCGGVF
jgi:hypothetical protein